MTTNKLEVVLLGPPLAKGRPRFVKSTGRTHTPERTLNYESRLAHAAAEAMADRPLLQGPLLAEVLIRMPIPDSKPKKWKEAALAGSIYPTKKPDVDNFAKMLDAMNLIVWTDDSQIVELNVRKIYSDKPAFVATITELEPKGAFG
ncbi:MAG: RusA family crossover junction endodeoxyribonuclease [Brucella intermedia]